jgi:anti-anti-sigma factor
MQAFESPGERAVSDANPWYQLDVTKSHAVVTFAPAISRAAWTEVQQVGNDLLTALNEKGAGAWVVDLSGLDYMGSALVACVVRVWKGVQEQGGRFVVVCGGGMPRDVINLSGLDRVWTLVQTQREGLERLGVVQPRDARGFVLAAAGLAAMLVAAGAVWLLQRDESSRSSLGLAAALFAGAGCAVVLGAVAAIASRSRLNRALGVLACVGGGALAGVGGLHVASTRSAPPPAAGRGQPDETSAFNPRPERTDLLSRSRGAA